MDRGIALYVVDDAHLRIALSAGYDCLGIAALS